MKKGRLSSKLYPRGFVKMDRASFEVVKLLSDPDATRAEVALAKSILYSLGDSELKVIK